MKTWSDPEPLVVVRPQKSHNLRRFTIAAFATCLFLAPYAIFQPGLTFPWLRFSPQDEDQQPNEAFKWSSISATKSLKFHSCYDGDIQCAKLAVPVDYFNGTYPGETISIAIAKVPAKVPVDDPRYGGPVLVNPGGPGGSGVLLSVLMGRGLQTIMDAHDPVPLRVLDDDEDAKYFDIIGFDPRGVGYTTPGGACFFEDSMSWSWALREASQGLFDSSNAALGRIWSMEHAFGASCKEAQEAIGEGFDIKEYMTTASVARDMLTIVEKHEEYNADLVSQIKATRPPCQNPGTWEARSKPSSSPKLQYFGFSYGTYLGYTFAAMYPDRVGRLVLDGVVNSDDYNESLGGDELADNEKAMHSFYTFCINAGPEICPLAKLASTPKAVEAEVQSILKSLLHHPLQFPSSYGPEILTYSEIKSIIFSSLYSPEVVFPVLSEILYAIATDDRPWLDMLINGLRNSHIYTCPLPSNDTSENPSYTPIPQTAILCGDGDSKQNDTLDTFKQYWHELQEVSPTSGSIWSTIRLHCSSWKFRPVHRWTGPFGAENTSHPILFTTNTADPVTPLRSARIMSKRFPGSEVLVQDSAGHCAVANPTYCTIYHVKSYFQTGALPPPNTFCVPPSTSAFALNSHRENSPFHISGAFAADVKIEADGFYESRVEPSVVEAMEGVRLAAVEGEVGVWPVLGMDKVRGVGRLRRSMFELGKLRMEGMRDSL